MKETELYQSPLTERYSSLEMQRLFSAHFKYSTWRRLWVALAQAEQTVGLPITDEQIKELQDHIAIIDFEVAARYEKQLGHDVMAHILAYGDQCPLAKPILHLGATSCYVTDNTDLIQMRDGFNILIPKLVKVINQLAQFAAQQANQPCLGYTHFQPAQLTTVGKRTCLWLQDLLMDYEELNTRSKSLRFLGAKGATGTQASFLALFNSEHDKVEYLDELIAEKMGFKNLFRISGQTYTRKQDMLVLSALAGLAATAHKFATDLRLLAHLKEVQEPFETKQVGSSAMPYKRNPVLSERVCSLSRFLISLNENAAYTFATQWLERSLDDSANRRLSLPEAFLTCDGILMLLLTITANLQTFPQIMKQHIQEELPFMAMENILMAAVKKGGDRQVLHEKLRILSHQTSKEMKEQGKDNDLLELLLKDSDFRLSKEELEKILNIQTFVGRAPQQVHEFLNTEVNPLISLIKN
jgi:adenylosuccinate lyase